MKKIILTLIFALTTITFCKAQKIEMKKAFGGHTFSQNGENLSVSEVANLMKENSEAYKLMKSAKSNYTWGMILGGAGGALIGFPIGTAIGGGDPEWALAGAGAALIVATIPIMKGFNKKTKKAVELYNAGVPTVSSSFQPQINFNLKGTQFGLTMSF